MHFASKKYAAILVSVIVGIKVLNTTLYQIPTLFKKDTDRDVLVRDNTGSDIVSRWKRVWTPDNVKQEIHALYDDGDVPMSDQPRYDGVDLMKQVIILFIMLDFNGMWI